MSQRRARILFAAGVSSSILAGLAIAGSSGATTTDSSAEPQPSCRSAETGPVDGPSQPGDGVADPAGRIAYAVVGRFDEAFGPIGTQLYAIDPDGSDRVLLLDCDVIPAPRISMLVTERGVLAPPGPEAIGALLQATPDGPPA